METTLQNTLVMAQTTAEEIKSDARKQADSILSQAQSAAQAEIANIDAQVDMKRRELEEMQRQFDTFKANMEALLISHLELLKNPLKGPQ